MHQESNEAWVQRVANASRMFMEQDSPHRWLVRQSMYTHPQRLVTLAMANLESPTGAILDVGAGTGALTLDLAWRAGNAGHVSAVDNDHEALKILRGVAKNVCINVQTITGEVTALPIKDANQDLTVARFVFQHLPNPSSALLEMKRVTRPGGRILIIDVDDGVALNDPPEPPRLSHLRKSQQTLQSQRGGNRLIGRHLYRLLCNAGLETIQMGLVPRLRLGLQYGRHRGMEAHQVESLLREREALIAAGLITTAEFDEAISELRQTFEEDRFEVAADFIATGVVPQKAK